MSRSKWPFIIVLLVLTLLAVGVVQAQVSANFGLGWHLVSGGGAPAATGSGDIRLNGSLGQPVIGASQVTGLDLHAGFWPGALGGVTIYLPLVQGPSS
jgi:hypothetical protein